MDAPRGRFIWTDPQGMGRNRYALFRRTFDLGAEPADGTLCIFADTRYRLLVNGTVLGHGPARFFPERPEYDVYDLTPALRQGRNVVAVMVNSYGVTCFHAQGSVGGLRAWGEATDVLGGLATFETDESWRATESPGHIPYGCKLSFALNAGEKLDARQLDADWAEPHYDDACWPCAVICADQAHWGPLAERSIPLLDEREVRPRRRVGVWSAALPEGEILHSFAVHGDPNARRPEAALAWTWLYSPEEQDVVLGAASGEWWLNGERLERRPRDGFPMRGDHAAHLGAGWNRLFTAGRLDRGVLECFLAVPAGAGIELSTERDAGSDAVFDVVGPFPCDREGRIEGLDLPLDSTDDLPADAPDSTAWPRGQGAEAPYLERNWRTFGRLADPAAPGPVAGGDYADAAPGGSISILFDFGTEVLGRPVLELTAAAGTRVDLSYSEALGDDDLPIDQSPWHVRMAERYIAREGRQEHQAFHPRGFRWLEIIVSGDLASFELHRVALTRANYPVEPLGSFRCSDPLLQRIWVIGRDTQHACMEDGFLDCPRRERGVYSGDFLVQFYVNLAAFGDRRLAARCIRLFLDAQDERGWMPPCPHGLAGGRHPDYTAIIVQAMWHYYANTGDVAFLCSVKNRLERIIGAIRSIALPEGGLYDGSDMHPYLDLEVMDRGGINCTLNCFYQRAFADGARIMDLLGEPDLADQYAAWGDELAAAIRGAFWDPDRRVFTDRRKADRADTGPSVAANTLPLLYGIAGENQVAGPLDFICEAVLDNFRTQSDGEGCNVNPYFSFYTLEVLYAHGRDDVAEAFMKQFWGHMVERGAWTWWEFGFDRASRCHAWSGAPTHYLSARVLGVTFPEPGNLDRVCIDPRPGSLQWAAGTYPHPRGLIRLAWEIVGESMIVTFDAPRGVEVELAD